MYASCFVLLTMAVVDSIFVMLCCIYSGGSGFYFCHAVFFIYSGGSGFCMFMLCCIYNGGSGL